MSSACGRQPKALYDTEFSVSLILATATKQYVASVLTNVRYHFQSYVCRSLGPVLRSVVCRITGVSRFDDVPEKKRWRREMGKAYDDVLYHRYGEDMKADAAFRLTIERHRHRLVPPLPPGTLTIDYDLCGKHRPFVYLGYMVRMTTFLEAMGEKNLPSPLPLKTSFIPAHYSIDTNSMAQLLMDQGRIAKFRHFFEHSVAGGFAVPKLTDKGMMGASLATLSGREAVTAEEEELFKDALWTYMARFKNRRTKTLNPLLHRKALAPGAMRFDHSVTTDGYSVSLVVSDRVVRGRKHQYSSAVKSRKKKVKTACDEEFPALKVDTAPDVKRLVEEEWGSPTLVGGDPGKNVILMLIDKRGRVLRYTGAQRRHETLQPLRSKAVRNAARRLTSTGYRSRDGSEVVPFSAAMVERRMRKGNVSPRTCNIAKFKEYVAFREKHREVLQTTYTRRLFRAMRFLAWTRRRATVEKFAKRILEKYGDGGPAAVQVAILYGDWGRRPNLKNQAPSPGIGLRRLLDSTDGIKTVTVHEAYTSSFCPVCSSGEVENHRGVHGLLRCWGCGRMWSRDVLGAKNILAKGLHLLQGDGPHPLFGA
jgi:hypothetical protein